MNYKIVSVILIIFILGVTTYFVKSNSTKKDEQEFNMAKVKIDAEADILKEGNGVDTDITGSNKVEYEIENKKVKGIVRQVVPEKNRIEIADYYDVYNDGFYCVASPGIEGYSMFDINISNDSKIINYDDNSEMDIEQINQGDVLLYEGNVNILANHISFGRDFIDVMDKNIYVLKKESIEKIACDNIGGKCNLENVRVLYSMDWEGDLYYWSDIMINIDNNIGDVCYNFIMKSDDNTSIIGNPPNEKVFESNVDIKLENNFSKVTDSFHGSVRKIKKITYK